MKNEQKPKWSKRKKILAILGIIQILVTVMMFQVPAEQVLAEGEGQVPEFITVMQDLGITNITLQLTDTNIIFELWDYNYTFWVKTAKVTITETHLALKNMTEILIFMDIDGATVDIPQAKLQFNKLLLEMSFLVKGETTFFRVVGKAYIPVYCLAQTLIEKAIDLLPWLAL